MSPFGFESISDLRDSLEGALLPNLIPMDDLTRFFRRNESVILFLVDSPSQSLESCQQFLFDQINSLESVKVYPVRFVRLRGKSRTLVQTLVSLLFLGSEFPRDLLAGLRKSGYPGIRKLLETLHSSKRGTAVRFLECRFCSPELLGSLGVSGDLSSSNNAAEFLLEAIKLYSRIFPKRPILYFGGIPWGGPSPIRLDQSLVELWTAMHKMGLVAYLVLTTRQQYARNFYDFHREIEQASHSLGCCEIVHVRRLRSEDATRIIRMTIGNCRDAERMKEIQARCQDSPTYFSSYYPFTELSLRLLVDGVSRRQGELNPISLTQSILDILAYAIGKDLPVITSDIVTRFFSARLVEDPCRVVPEHLKMFGAHFLKGDLSYDSKLDRITPFVYLRDFRDIDRRLCDLGYTYDSAVKSWVKVPTKKG